MVGEGVPGALAFPGLRAEPGVPGILMVMTRNQDGVGALDRSRTGVTLAKSGSSFVV